jgi:hypothetical protein
LGFDTMTAMSESAPASAQWWSASQSERRAFIRARVIDWPPLTGSQLDRLGAIFEAAQQRQAADQAARSDADGWTENQPGRQEAG